ncbi:hypothetical protein Tco_0358017 [Tanacetum coccineum]
MLAFENFSLPSVELHLLFQLKFYPLFPLQNQSIYRHSRGYRLYVILNSSLDLTEGLRNGVPKMKGLFSSSFMSKITKSTGYTCSATLTNKSSAIPKG